LTDFLYAIRTLQGDGVTPLGGVSIHADSANGEWNAVTDDCGWFHAYLHDGVYDVIFSKAGYTNTVEKWNLLDPPKDSIQVALKEGSDVLPSIPTRTQVCSVQHSLQGLTYNTLQYGPVPAWFYAKLSSDDRIVAREAHRRIGDTHIPIPISEAYRETGTLWPTELKDGYDYTQDLKTYKDRILEVVVNGFFVDSPLAGDGLGAGPAYNDPIGRTYGHEWLMANLERIIRYLQEPPDLTPYICFRPGWDAVFYGWGDATTRSVRWRKQPRVQLSAVDLDNQQKRVRDFGLLFRQLLPAGYLSIEHTPGDIPVGLGPSDYDFGGVMRSYDTMMGEFNTVHEDSFWQVAGRMLDPYNRPSDQPAGDDPHPPKYLAPGNERGPYFYVCFEPTVGGAYQWARGTCSLQDVRDVNNYMRACGATLTGYSGR
jgi:hypothetical protein